MPIPSAIAAVAGLLLLAPMFVRAADEAGSDSPKIHAGDKRFRTPEFEDYEALFGSGSSSTGVFTLQVRKTGKGGAISLLDIIPGTDYVIVAQRQIDARSHAVDFSAGPFYAWGEEFVVQQMAEDQYDWVRVPVGGGEPRRMAGELENGSFVSDLFTPTLASLMPMAEGSRFQLPVAVPRKDNFVSSWWEEFEVLRRERLKTPSGLDCECWVIEKRLNNGGKTHIWVAREAPFVFKRHRDVGGRRSLVSELEAFRKLVR